MEKIKIGVNAEHGFNMLKGHLFADTDVFLREIVSNSIDAIKARAMLDTAFNEVLDAEIRIYTDQSMKTISVLDNGIGMTRQEAIDNLGIIFQSSKAEGGFIGTFGIGFYSCLKVAENVEILTRSATQDKEGSRLIFDGSDFIKVCETLRDSIGTEVKISLKKEYADEYTNIDNIDAILLKYFKFAHIPIFIENSPEPISQIKPLYLMEDPYISEEQWIDFIDQNISSFKPITYHVLDKSGDINGILTIPRSTSRMNDLDFKLYVNHVFIKDKANELISPPFRPIIGGLIDVKKLPISLSRDEELKSSPELRDVREKLNLAIINWLSDCAQEQASTFEEILEHHDQSIKRACIESHELFDKIHRCLSFKSSFKSKVILGEYLERIAPDQPVFYLSSPEDQGPILNLYNQKNIDVIFFTSPEDLQLLQKLKSFYVDKRFVRIDEYDPGETDNEKKVIFGISEDRQLEEQLRQLFRRFVDEDIDIQLKRLPNRNLCSIILKDKSSQLDEVYSLFFDLYFPEMKRDLQQEVPEELLRAQFVEFMKDKAAPRVLILNETNPAVQRLGFLLSQKSLFGINELLESMAKSIYFIAIASSREEMTKDQAEEFSQIYSKILDNYGALSLNSIRAAVDVVEDSYKMKNNKSLFDKLKWW